MKLVYPNLRTQDFDSLCEQKAEQEKDVDATLGKGCLKSFDVISHDESHYE